MKILALVSLLIFISFKSSADVLPLYFISTEEYPPYNYYDESTSQVLGHSTKKVRDLMRVAGFNYEIRLYPWMRAYNRALNGPRYCVYSTARNAERENKFHWIGPLVTVEWALFAKKGTPAANVQNLQQAKRYVVGGLEGDASLEELKKLGFKTESVVTNWLNRDKLVGQRIQLWLDDPVYIEFEQKRGTEFFEYVKVARMTTSELYLACNIDTPLNEIEMLKKAAR